MQDVLPIIIRLPDGLKDQYDTPINQGIFERDLRSDRLIMRILPEDYNAANTINLNTKLGYRTAFDEKRRDLYKLEATDTESRSLVKRLVLNDLLRSGGNLSIYGIDQGTGFCLYPRVAIEDHHYLSEVADHERGYSLRVGTLQVEELKGSYGKKDKVVTGDSYILSPKSAIHTAGAVLDASEWSNYNVLRPFNTKQVVDATWSPNSTYLANQKIAAIAPSGVASISNRNKGCRLIFTHTHSIVDNNLVPYLPDY